MCVGVGWGGHVLNNQYLQQRKREKEGRRGARRREEERKRGRDERVEEEEDRSPAGWYTGFVFPWRRRDTMDASLPTTCPRASIRYHSRVRVARLCVCVYVRGG